ncbi:MAG: hypothetical protein ACPGVO_18130 [Spirulinaceae cyanobacterium]
MLNRLTIIMMMSAVWLLCLRIVAPRPLLWFLLFILGVLYSVARNWKHSGITEKSWLIAAWVVAIVMEIAAGLENSAIETAISVLFFLAFQGILYCTVCGLLIWGTISLVKFLNRQAKS